MERCCDHSAHEWAINAHGERISAHGQEIDGIKNCIERLTALQEHQGAWQERAEERLAALESAPARRWDSAVTCLLTAAIGVVVGVLASHLGF